MSQPYQNPPAPGYGGAYGGTYYSPQSPYGPRPPYSPSHFPQPGAHPPAPFQSAPADAFSVARFDANSQAHPQAQPFPFAPTSFPPEMLKQFANSSIPPPPPPGFPPLSFPNLNFPTFPPVPTAPNQSYSPPHQAASDEGSDAYDPRFPQNILQPPRQAVSAASSKNKSQLQTHPTESFQTLAHGLQLEPTYQQNNTQFPPAVDASASLPTPNHPQYLPTPNSSKPSLPMGSVLSNVGRVETQPSFTELSAAQRQLSGNNNNVLPIALQVDAQANPSEAEHEEIRRDYDKMGAEELRNHAKGALMSLAPHNISLDELAKEGINSDVLSTLYGELGLPMKSKSKLTENANPDRSVSNPITNDGTVEKSVQLPSTASPGLERKDRIAQLLAAKAMKSGPVRPVSDSGNSAAAQEATAGNLQSASARLAPQDTTPALKSKGIAQAEFVRQKMESLREETLENQTAQASAEVGSTAQSYRSEVAIGDTQSTASSMLPGLGMMSVDLEPVPSMVPAKRTLEADSATSDAITKRRNTGIFAQPYEVKMDTSRSTSQENSDGEVVESPPPVEAHPPTKGEDIRSLSGTDLKAAEPQSKPFSPVPVGRLTPAQMAEKARELKARFLQQRARQQALQEGLPDLAAEVARREDLVTTQRSQLEDTRRRIKALELDLANARRQEQEQEAQISRSEEQIRQGVSGQQKFAEELQTLSKQQSSVNRSLDDAQRDSEVPLPAADRQQDAATQRGPDASPRADDANAQSDLSPTAAIELPFAVQMEEKDQLDGPGHDRVREEAEGHGPISGKSSVSMGETTEPSEDGVDQNAIEEDTYFETNKEPATESPFEETMVDDAESDGSASMMDSASATSHDEGEYSPPEEDATQPMDIDDGASEEDYDPSGPREDFVHKDEGPNVGEKSPDKPSQEGVGQTQASVPRGEADTDVDDEQAAIRNGLDLIEQQEVTTIAGPLGIEGSDADYRPSRSSAPATPNGRWVRGRQNAAVKPLSNNGSHRSTSFSAYESPLTSFPSYRYNEHYSDTIKDGYRSLTYSNSIDPRTPLCRTELSGETCLDSTCEEQHFRHLGLSDDKILVQMSSAQEFIDKETREKYLLGLKDIIADLRSRNVRDFEDVAKALSEYRRTFVATL